MTGVRFGRLTVLNRAEDYKRAKGSARDQWLCLCDCGTEKKVLGFCLRGGTVKSCGCLRRETTSARNRTHGFTDGRLYNVWKGMKQRCSDRNHNSYDRYGGRGISVCDEWLDYEKFREWAMNAGYVEDAAYGACTLDRIMVDGDYEPGNCRWVTSEIQANNKSNNHLVTYNGETHTIAEWAKKIGVQQKTLRARLGVYGWSVEKAIETPVRSR